MRRAEGREDDAQLGLGDLDVGGAREGGLDERASLVVGPLVVGRDHAHEVAFGLVGHSDEIHRPTRRWLDCAGLTGNRCFH